MPEDTEIPSSPTKGRRSLRSLWIAAVTIVAFIVALLVSFPLLLRTGSADNSQHPTTLERHKATTLANSDNSNALLPTLAEEQTNTTVSETAPTEEQTNTTLTDPAPIEEQANTTLTDPAPIEEQANTTLVGPWPIEEQTNVTFGDPTNSTEDPPQLKIWDELVGVDGEQAKVTILEETGNSTKVYIVPPDHLVTTDYRLDRVRIYVDEEGKVTEPPTFG